MKVDVYWNLHKQTFSIRSREKGDYGRVIRHADHVHIRNPTAVVSKAGRERVLREKKKNVHAVIRGELAGTTETQPWILDHNGQYLEPYAWYYNPYEYDQFVCARTDHTWPAIENVADHEWANALLRRGPNGRPVVKGYRK